MKESKEYRSISKLPKSERNKAYNRVKEKYKFTKFDIVKFATPIRVNEFSQIDSNTVQKLAQRAFMATENVMYGKSKRVNFKRKGEMDSVEGASNKQGIKYRDGKLIWNKLCIPVSIKKNDYYAHEALTHDIKFCRIVRKLIKSKVRFFIQIVLDGIPPRKIDNETGMFKGRHGYGRVGIDIGTQTIAISSRTDVKLLELAPEVNNIERKKRVLQRKLSRQRRSSNPNKYNEDGTTKRGNKDKWLISKNYTKTRNQLAELQRKVAAIRRQSHNKLTHYIMGLGNEFYVEKMNYQALQSRSKETTINQKTNKFNKKKRFGKSIGNKAPSMLLSLLNQKLGYWRLNLKFVDTFNFKASQYNHFTDEYIKKSLNERWNMFECGNIQRDMYSAFLIMNSDSTLRHTNRKLCFENWNEFRKLHDVEIERLINNRGTIGSMGI